MEVFFYATFRPAVGGKSADVPVGPGDTLRELIDAAVGRFPALNDLLLDDAGELSRHVHLFVNGRGAVHLPEGLDTKIAAGDRIDFFPAVAGGSA